MTDPYGYVLEIEGQPLFGFYHTLAEAKAAARCALPQRPAVVVEVHREPQMSPMEKLIGSFLESVEVRR